MRRKILALLLIVLLAFNSSMLTSTASNNDSPVMVEENLLLNSGFETGDFTAWPLLPNSYTNAEIDTIDRHSGSNSLKITSRQFTYSGARQEIALEMGTTYHVSAWVKLAESGVVKISLEGLYQIGIVEQEVQANTWTLVSGTITPTASAGYSHFLVHTTQSLADLWIDDVSLSKNYLKNPGFETGDFTAWPLLPNSYTNAAIDTTDRHGGSNSLKITSRQYTYSGARQEVALELGTTYHVTAWVKLAESGIVKISLEGLYQTGIVEQEVQANTWTLVNGTITPTASAGYSHFLVHTTQSLADLWIDDVSLSKLVEAPAPETTPLDLATEKLNKTDFSDLTFIENVNDYIKEIIADENVTVHINSSTLDRIDQTTGLITKGKYQEGSISFVLSYPNLESVITNEYNVYINENLIINSTFGSGNTNSWNYQSPSIITVSDTEKHTGNYCVLIDGRTKASHGIKQYVPEITGGKSYEVSAWVKLGQSEDTGVVAIEYTNSKGIRKTQNVFGRVTFDQWSKISGTIMLEENISDVAFIVKLAYSVSKMYVDDIQCNELLSDVPGEVLKNTNFEQGNIRGWEATRWASISVKNGGYNSSNYGAEVTAREYYYAGPRQAVSVQGGKTYKLGAWVKISEDETVRVLIEHTGGTSIVEADVIADTWTRVEGIVQLPKGTITGSQFVVCTKTSTANFSIDDATCQEIVVEKSDPSSGIIQNGGFEDESSWGAEGGIFGIVSSTKFAGKHSGILSGRNSNTGKLYQAVSLQNGKNYELSAWAKLGEGCDNIIAAIEYEVGGIKRSISLAEYCSSADWSHIKGIINVNEGSEISNSKIVFYTEQSTADIHIDSSSLYEAEKSVNNENLLNNNNFENGYNNWQSVGTGVLTSVSDAHLGNSAVKVSGRMYKWYSVRQPVTIEPGEAYQMSAWVKLANGATTDKANARVIIEYLSDGNPSSESVTADISSGNWTYVTGVFTAPDSQIEGAMFTICTSDSLSDIIVDDATFKKVIKNDDLIIDKIDNESLESTMTSLLRNIVLKNERQYTISANITSDIQETVFMGVEYYLDGIKNTKQVQKHVAANTTSVVSGQIETEATGEITEPKFLITTDDYTANLQISDVVFNDETVSNGDFEYAIVNNSWFGQNASIIPEHEKVYSNECSLKVTNRRSTQGALHHYIGVCANKSYTVSAVVKPTLKNDIGQIGIKYTLDGVTKYKYIEMPISVAGFTIISGRVDLNGEIGKIENAQLIIKTKNSKNDFYVDNVSCTMDEIALNVDLKSDIRNPNYQSSGFLHAFDIDGEGPPDHFITALKPQSHRLGVWYGNWNRAIMTDRLGIKIQNNIPNYVDIIGGEGTKDEKVRTLIERSNNELTNSQTYWDLFNEYSLIAPYNSENSQAFYDAWTEEYDRVKRIDPNAKIVGPSMELFNFDVLKDFLIWAKGVDRLPNMVSWHFSDDTYYDVTRLREFLSQNNINVELSMNEFMWPNELTSSVNAWYLARNERANINANTSNWSGSHILCDTIRKDDDGNWMTRGRWWVYKRYADMTGMLVNSKSSEELFPKVEILASKDGTGAVRALVGKKTYMSNFNTDITFDNISSTPYIVKDGVVRVILEKMPNKALKQPIIVVDTNIAVVNNRLTLSIPWDNVYDAYAITLLKPDSVEEPTQGSRRKH